MAKSAQDYIIETATIETSVGLTIDLKTSIVELALFEDIENPFITGTIVVVDSQNFINSLNFTGTEKFTLSVRSGDGDAAYITKTFLMIRINRMEHANDTTRVYSIELLEEHAFISRITKISQAFNSPPVGIIKRLLSTIQEDLDLNETLLSSTPVQENIKLITPYLQPLQAVEWVRDRCTTSAGMPFFLYSSLQYNGIVITSLEDILNRGPWNKTPFVYSQGSVRLKDNTVTENPYAIETFEAVDTDDTLNALMNGAVAAQWNVLDLFNMRFNSNETTQYNIGNIIPNNSVYDTDALINNKPLNQYPAKQYYQVVSSNLFPDTGNYHIDGSIDALQTKIINKGIRNAMLKNMVDIEVNGLPFMKSASGTVGSVIQVEALNTDSKSGDLLDAKRSGEYIVMALRHTFAENKYSISASVTKLANTLNDKDPKKWIK